MYNPWKDNAITVEQEFGGFVDYGERFYICPECGEPVYESDWPIYKFEDFICPICEWEGD